MYKRSDQTVYTISSKIDKSTEVFTITGVVSSTRYQVVVETRYDRPQGLREQSEVLNINTPSPKPQDSISQTEVMRAQDIVLSYHELAIPYILASWSPARVEHVSGGDLVGYKVKWKAECGEVYCGWVEDNKIIGPLDALELKIREGVQASRLYEVVVTSVWTGIQPVEVDSLSVSIFTSPTEATARTEEVSTDHELQEATMIGAISAAMLLVVLALALTCYCCVCKSKAPVKKLVKGYSQQSHLTTSTVASRQTSQSSSMTDSPTYHDNSAIYAEVDYSEMAPPVPPRPPATLIHSPLHGRQSMSKSELEVGPEYDYSGGYLWMRPGGRVSCKHQVIPAVVDGYERPESILARLARGQELDVTGETRPLTKARAAPSVTSSDAATSGYGSHTDGVSISVDTREETEIEKEKLADAYSMGTGSSCNYMKVI